MLVTSLSAVELCVAGLWRRIDEGYEILDRDMLEIAIRSSRRLGNAALCDATGGHEPDLNSPYVCRKCGAPIP
jgi:hypothetical protein